MRLDILGAAVDRADRITVRMVPSWTGTKRRAPGCARPPAVRGTEDVTGFLKNGTRRELRHASLSTAPPRGKRYHFRTKH
jgi:hypothetical protein